jgi:2'-5' RNA ligase
MNVPRAFAALDLDDSALDALHALAEALRASAPKGLRAQWTRREQMHVTLKFLGAATEAQVASLAHFVGTLAHGSPPALRIAGLGAFPDAKRARIVMARVEDLGPGTLTKMQEATEEYGASLGFARETRAYAPHVTLARLREPRDARAWLDDARVEPRLATVTAVALYRSDPSPEGSRYEALVRAPFALVAT